MLLMLAQREWGEQVRKERERDRESERASERERVKREQGLDKVIESDGRESLMCEVLGEKEATKPQQD